MKNLTFAFLVLVFLVPIRADEYLKNGDFSEGLSHWDGDVKNLADQGSDPDATSLTTTTTAPKSGLLIELKSSKWMKATQDFRSKGSSLTVTFTLAYSADASFSPNVEDYANVTHAIDFDAWGPIRIHPGNWMLMLSNLGAPSGKTGAFFDIKPKLGSTDQVTLTYRVDSLMPDTDKTLTFAFPPGHGSVMIYHVSVSDTP